MLERFRLFDDDVFVSKMIPIWMGAGFEASLFGMTVRFFDDVDPWIVYENTVINEPDDLEKLALPDFYKSGLMPETIKMYEGVRAIFDDDFDVLFPEWLRGPFGLATYIRGFEKVLMDMIDTPEFSHKTMEFIVAGRKAWYESFSQYSGKPSGKANLFNDEVNTPSLSPNLYEEFVLPYEIELHEFHGGFLYYHSCGNLSILYPRISKITDIDMIHKSPWSDPAKVAKSFGQRSAIEVCMNPQADICDGTDDSIRALLTNIVGIFNENKVKGYTLRANNIQIYEKFSYSIKKSIDKAILFIKVAREVVDSITKA
jgi:uroporphyrinogen-III decarboxylase